MELFILAQQLHTKLLTLTPRITQLNEQKNTIVKQTINSVSKVVFDALSPANHSRQKFQN